MAPVSLQRKEFVAEVTANPIKVADAKADSRLEGIDFDKVDLNGDGEISGKKEATAFFDQIDRFDKDGKDVSVLISDKGVANDDVQTRVAAVGDLAKSAKLQRVAHAHEEGNDDVIFIGMRKINKLESDSLIKSGKKNGFDVKVIGSKDDGTITVDKTKYDLKTDDGMRDFAKSLKLSQDAEDGVFNALKMTNPDGRKELAELALIWNKAEKGEKVPSRLVISGHSSNGNFAGDYGNFSGGALTTLAHAMPKGAAQLEDLHLAGCYGNGVGTARAMKEAFPNLKTLWGYDQTAPTSDGGAVEALKVWDGASRGRVGIMDRKIAKDTAHGEEVIVWSAQGDFQAARPMKSLDDLKATVDRKDSYQEYFVGDREVRNPHNGRLREYYNALNDLARHPDLSDKERAEVGDKIDRTIRLLYFGDIAKAWASENKDAIAAGYKAAGIDKVPNFAKMDREAAVKEISSFYAKNKDSKDPAIQELNNKLGDLYWLNPKELHLSWLQ